MTSDGTPSAPLNPEEVEKELRDMLHEFALDYRVESRESRYQSMKPVFDYIASLRTRAEQAEEQLKTRTEDAERMAKYLRAIAKPALGGKLQQYAAQEALSGLHHSYTPKQ